MKKKIGQDKEMKGISDKERNRRDLLKTLGQVNSDTLRTKGKLYILKISTSFSDTHLILN